MALDKALLEITEEQIREAIKAYAEDEGWKVSKVDLVVTGGHDSDPGDPRGGGRTATRVTAKLTVSR